MNELENAIVKIANQLSMDKDMKEGILALVIGQASLYFKNCPYDFCIQHVSNDCVVFGGTNRLLWSPARGFSPDKSYCTPKFLEQYNMITERL